MTLAAINALSAIWGTRIHTVFTVSKVTALLMVIIAGVVKMAQGRCPLTLVTAVKHWFDNW